MSRNRLVLNTSELRAQLRALPAELGGEAAHVIEGTTNSAAQLIKAAYGRHRRSGKLSDSVQSSVERGAFGAVGTVKNTSKIAHIFEQGTQARHTALGANRGSMPPAHVFVPVILRERRRMYEQLKAILARAGLAVSGDAR